MGHSVCGYWTRPYSQLPTSSDLPVLPVCYDPENDSLLLLLPISRVTTYSHSSYRTMYLISISSCLGFLSGSVGKESACNAGDSAG